VAPGRITLADGETIRVDLAIDVRGVGASLRESQRFRANAHGQAAPVTVLHTSTSPALRQAQNEQRGPSATDAVRGVRGVRGEIIWLHAPSVRLLRPVRLLHPRHRVYIVPRPGDRFVVGASEIESEDRSPVSLRSAVELMSAAHSVIPELAEARIVHMESNLRPALPDNEPHTHIEPGLLRINGLFRHGWLLAPALVQDALAALGLGLGASEKETHHV
jgi:glycine oxidase